MNPDCESCLWRGAVCSNCDSQEPVLTPTCLNEGCNNRKPLHSQVCKVCLMHGGSPPSSEHPCLECRDTMVPEEAQLCATCEHPRTVERPTKRRRVATPSSNQFFLAVPIALNGQRARYHLFPLQTTHRMQPPASSDLDVSSSDEEDGVLQHNFHAPAVTPAMCWAPTFTCSKQGERSCAVDELRVHYHIVDDWSSETRCDITVVAEKRIMEKCTERLELLVRHELHAHGPHTESMLRRKLAHTYPPSLQQYMNLSELPTILESMVDQGVLVRSGERFQVRSQSKPPGIKVPTPPFADPQDLLHRRDACIVQAL